MKLESGPPVSKLVALFTLLIAALFAAPAMAAPVKTPHLTAELVSQTTSVAPGSTAYIALRQAMIPEWHTYWRNPGDAGEPTTLKWTLPPGVKAGGFVWPTPQFALLGPIASYVFSNTVYLPIPIDIPATAKPGSSITLKAHGEWLICKDICVPEGGDFSITLPVSAGSATLDPKHGAAISDTLAHAPKPAGIKATFKNAPGKLTLSATGVVLKGASPGRAFFFPYDGSSVEHAKPELVQAGPQGLTFTLTPGFAFAKGKPPATLAGVIVVDADHAYELTAGPGAPLPGAAGSKPPVVATPSSGHATGGSASGGLTFAALAVAAGSAFVGGLILNLMPCVFPVLAIKAAQLVRHGDHPAAARAEGLAFLVGVVATFVALAGALLILRAGGEAVGWGFQLQDSRVVAALGLLMLAVALNLSGVFEIGSSVQGVGSGLAAKGGLAGAFFTGVLAVVVAAPCTAPFMATAIGWAFAQPPAAALLVFAFLGLGLAAPFVLLAFTPALARRMPKPGAWMEGFRHILAFPVYATAAWLAWVFASQAGTLALPFLFGAAITVAFGAWVWGVAQRREAITGAAPWLLRATAAIFVLLAIPAVVQGAAVAPATASTPTAGETAGGGGGIPTEPWSAARVAELQAQGHPVFVDFTAAWCVTCQVNERTALAGKSVADVFAAKKAVYLKADWTKRDPVIADTLTALGRSGVPLYLVYTPGKAEPAILPQLLTEGLVIEAIEAAVKPA